MMQHIPIYCMIGEQMANKYDWYIDGNTNNHVHLDPLKDLEYSVTFQLSLLSMNIKILSFQQLCVMSIKSGMTWILFNFVSNQPVELGTYWLNLVDKQKIQCKDIFVLGSLNVLIILSIVGDPPPANTWWKLLNWW